VLKRYHLSETPRGKPRGVSLSAACQAAMLLLSGSAFEKIHKEPAIALHVAASPIIQRNRKIIILWENIYKHAK